MYNDEWAEFGNLDLEDLNRLERDFLGAIDWSCYVAPDSFEKQLAKLEALVALREYLKRTSKHQQQTYTPGPTNIGMTYTELLSLTNYLRQGSPAKSGGKDLNFYWTELGDIAESILLCSLAYCAAVVVIVSSVSLVFTLQLALHHHRSLEFNSSSDNFTLQSMPQFEFAATFDTRPLHIQTTYFAASAKRQNLTPTDQVNYHLLLKQKANKILKCS